jgi:hypothetical protein
MHGRYPDYDVLEQVDHWDEVTRRVVLDRVERTPPIRFFDERESATLGCLCDLLLAQDAEPRVPVLAFVDEKQHGGRGDGYQYEDLPPDSETWRIVARALDEEARKLGRESFAELDEHDALEVCHRFSKGELSGGAWEELNVSRAFSVVIRDTCEMFFSHPWEWNEMGFGGPAYPRGYAAFGSPDLGEREHWEQQEAFEIDPVEDVQERGLD